MTMKVQEQTISVERKTHPNAVRYPCRATHEVLEAGRKLLTSLSQAERDLLLQNDLILDEEETGELFDAFQENDIIGLGILRSDGFYSNTYRIEKIHSGEDWLECENAYSKEVEEISFQDVSVAMALGFAEILYRNDKPFGVSDKYDFTIKYHIEEDDEEDATANAGNVGPVGGFNAGSTDESEGISEGSNDSSITPETSTKVSEDSSETESELEQVPSIEFHQTYFAFGFDEDAMTHYVVITPAKLWDEQKVICDQGSADPLAKKLGLEPLMDSTYEYDHQYSESQLRHLLTAFRATEKSEMLSDGQ